MANIGSSEWFTQAADKVIDTGLSIIKTKLDGVDNTRNGPAVYQTQQSSIGRYIPYVIGAAVIGGIALILAKR